MIRMEVDYSSTVEEKIPECEKLAKENKLNEALEILLSLEKQARTGGDTHSLGRLLVTVAKLCFEKKDWKLLSDNIVLLTKRRGQIKQAVTKLVQECCTYVDAITDKQTKLDFIDTLRSVTAGKIYVEVERARLTYKLACMKEADGDVVEAANLLQELQVETFGTMERREKVELLLEQIRLGLAKKDYIRTQIVAKKIQVKFFEDEAQQDLKLRYYKLMIELDDVDRAYLKACKHYRAVYSTPSIQADLAKKQEVMKNIVLYIVLSPYDNEQSDLIHRIAQEKFLEELTSYNDLLKLFNTAELINWLVLETQFQAVLRVGTPECPATAVFAKTEAGDQRWKDLKNRVVEHNIRIMAKYYKRVTLKRMAELLSLSPDETEEMLTNLVVNKTIWAKVNRLEGVVNFKATKPANEVLNDWSLDITTLMNNVCKASHLINKELMVHQHLHKTTDHRSDRSVHSKNMELFNAGTLQNPTQGYALTSFAHFLCTFENVNHEDRFRELKQNGTLKVTENQFIIGTSIVSRHWIFVMLDENAVPNALPDVCILVNDTGLDRDFHLFVESVFGVARNAPPCRRQLPGNGVCCNPNHRLS